MSKLPDFLGPYRLARFIRVGSSTQIYEAIKDDGSGRYVLKILRSQLWGNKAEAGYLRHEFEVGHSLDHDAVIRILEHGTQGKVSYLVLEKFAEFNLKQVFQNQGIEVIWVSLAQIVEQCIGGLHHLHDKGWVHCDIKPDNFLLDEQANVKLIDFTIAQKASRGKMLAMFRKRGAIRGTRSYMSPEQIRGESLDRRSDVYSFGCLLYELMCGKPPFTGESPNDLLNKHLRAPIPSVQVANDNVMPEMAEFLRRLMAKQPADRPDSMADVLKEFRGVRRPFRSAPRLKDE